LSPSPARPSKLLHSGAVLPAGFELREAYVEASQASDLMEDLLATADLETHRIHVFGRSCPMPRRIAWFGQESYSYSGVHHPARPLPENLKRIAEQLRLDLDQPFNCVLLNHYLDGRDSMGWHSDDDYAAGDYPKIASISLGGTRRFRLRPKGDPARSIGMDLTHGSLLTMGAGTQLTHQHAVPRTRRKVDQRLNLTFRWMEPK